MTMRAQTLADVAAQLFAGYIIIDELLDGDLSECKFEVLKLRRVILSALPVVAEAAGVELAALGGEYIKKCTDHEFPSLREDA
jgi:hypothetical protein